MTQLPTGTYYGDTTRRMEADGLIISQVAYRPSEVDWHYHENAFFSFVLDGELTEHTPKGKYHCPAGTLLFQNWDEMHYNAGAKAHTSFYVELRKDWFEKNAFDAPVVQGHLQLTHPGIKILFHQLYRETMADSPRNGLAIDELLVRIFDGLAPVKQKRYAPTPNWVAALTAMLHELPEEKLTLEGLSRELGIHPVHLCRYFAKHFHCTLGEYLRQVRVEHALSLLRDRRLSLTEIAYRCGFADQSHFNRCFKAANRVTPFQYRESLTG